MDGPQADYVTHLIATYGYIAIGCIIALESMGLPLPGESALVAAALYASHHDQNIAAVVAAAATGAVVGDNVGYWIGREFGYRLLLRYGAAIGLSASKIKLGQYLFMRHGGKVVFFGRFVAVLRTWAAFLAGTNRMRWPRFLFFNAAGGIIWATLYGLGGYLLGYNVHRLTGPVGTVTLVLAVLVIIAFLVFLRRN